MLSHTFIQHECVKLNRSDSRDFYCSVLEKNCFKLSIQQKGEKKKEFPPKN